MRNPKLGELPAAVNSAKVVEVNTTLVVDMGEESPLPQNGRLVRGRTEAHKYRTICRRWHKEPLCHIVTLGVAENA